MQNQKNSGRSFRFPVKEEDFKMSINTVKHEKPRCVQVAIKARGVAVRDSKDATRTTLYFKKMEWRAFVKGVKSGEFD